MGKDLCSQNDKFFFFHFCSSKKLLELKITRINTKPRNKQQNQWKFIVTKHFKMKLLTLMFTVWKESKYGVFSGPYFPAFGLNTERYGAFFRIQSECGKIRTRKNSVFGHFPRSGCLHCQFLLYKSMDWFLNDRSLRHEIAWHHPPPPPWIIEAGGNLLKPTEFFVVLSIFLKWMEGYVYMGGQSRTIISVYFSY